MRYFTLTYYKQPNGSINEVANTVVRLKQRDINDCNVILDFQEHKVLKCTVNGTGIAVDWLSVIDYFSKYYNDTFQQLILANKEQS